MSGCEKKPVMIMAGGTGGHVYPALAVADELRARGVAVVWLGTRKGIEARLVPEAGIPMEWMGVNGLRGKGVMQLMMAPFNLLLACAQAMRIMLKRNPCTVLGMGGFVSGPGGLVAWLLRKPLLIHEQNAIPGLTNRLLAKMSGQVMAAFPDSFGQRSMHVGNPVRKSITAIESPDSRFDRRSDALRLLVFGGSLGAARFNEVIPQALASLDKTQRPQVRHQAGPKNIEQAIENYHRAGVEARVDAYIDDMAEAYDWADLVICRSGAMTVAELSAAGVASILVPYPYAVDDHQTANARYLSDVDGAILLPEKEMAVDKLADTLKGFTREQAKIMAQKARSLGMPESTNLVTEQCLLAGGGAC
ncbi:MAG: undecaprenyldiphospho-muramoylpentapeptide beta-N-acetylglucosaminyltransferase [Gammaproteobacteria bacterium]